MHAVEKRNQWKNKSILTSAIHLVSQWMQKELIYYPVLSVQYTCLYNIFLNVEAVHRLEKRCVIFWFLNWHLFGGFLPAVAVTVVIFCSLQ